MHPADELQQLVQRLWRQFGRRWDNSYAFSLCWSLTDWLFLNLGWRHIFRQTYSELARAILLVYCPPAPLKSFDTLALYKSDYYYYYYYYYAIATHDTNCYIKLATQTVRYKKELNETQHSPAFLIHSFYYSCSLSILPIIITQLFSTIMLWF